MKTHPSGGPDEVRRPEILRRLDAKEDLTNVVSYVFYNSEGKNNSTIVGLLGVPVQDLMEQNAQYTSQHYRLGKDSETSVVKGKLQRITQPYLGGVALSLLNPLSGATAEIQGGILVQSDTKGLVAKFDDLKLIE